MMDNQEKRENLSKMIDEMAEENMEKFFNKGDKLAGQRLVQLSTFKAALQSTCSHVWESDGTGHFFCSKCGADGGSAWDC